MCRLELRSTHILYKYVTFQPGKFSKLGGNVSFGIKKYPYPLYICNIQPDTFSELGGNVSFGIKKYPYHLDTCNISARRVFEIRRKCVV
jgi:hypothetical protein